MTTVGESWLVSSYQYIGGGDGGAPFGGGGNPDFAQEMPQFARGGYTGDGASSEVAGIVHRGEYVVPSGGALVIRESDTAPQSGPSSGPSRASGGSSGQAEVVTLLAAILAQLEAGGGTILIDKEMLRFKVQI